MLLLLLIILVACLFFDYCLGSLLASEYATAMVLYEIALLDVVFALLVVSTALSASCCICVYRAYLNQTLC